MAAVVIPPSHLHGSSLMLNGLGHLEFLKDAWLCDAVASVCHSMVIQWMGKDTKLGAELRGAPASVAGKPQEPTILAMHSQHIHAEATGWRTPKGLLLREPIKASFTYTPALAKLAPSPPLPVGSRLCTDMFITRFFDGNWLYMQFCMSETTVPCDGSSCGAHRMV